MRYLCFFKNTCFGLSCLSACPGVPVFLSGVDWREFLSWIINGTAMQGQRGLKLGKHHFTKVPLIFPTWYDKGSQISTECLDLCCCEHTTAATTTTTSVTKVTTTEIADLSWQKQQVTKQLYDNARASVPSVSCARSVNRCSLPKKSLSNPGCLGDISPVVLFPSYLTKLKLLVRSSLMRVCFVFTVWLHYSFVTWTGMGAKGAASFERLQAEKVVRLSNELCRPMEPFRGCWTPRPRMKLALLNQPGADGMVSFYFDLLCNTLLYGLSYWIVNEAEAQMGDNVKEYLKRNGSKGKSSKTKKKMATKAREDIACMTCVCTFASTRLF